MSNRAAHRLRQLGRRISYAFSADAHSFRRGFVSPEENYKRRLLRRVQQEYQLKIFVETGTFEGGTVLYLAPYFDHLVSIEISAQYVRAAQHLVASHKNVEILQGDSAEILPIALEGLETPAFFWLDGHYSGDQTGGVGITHPLARELEHIAATGISDHVVVIDDMSDFSGERAEIYLDEIIAKVRKINPNFVIYSDYDMLFCLPGEPVHRNFFRKLVPHVLVR